MLTKIELAFIGIIGNFYLPNKLIEEVQLN